MRVESGSIDSIGIPSGMGSAVRLLESPLNPGDKGWATLTSIAMGGDAIGRFDNFVIFVPYGAPQDEIEFEVLSVKKRFARCKLMRIVRASPMRVEPRCQVYSRCGGCQLQHLEYPSQLQCKQGIVEDAFLRIGRLRDVKVRTTIGLDNPWFYRNKVQIVAATPPGETNGAPLLGLYEKGTHSVVTVDGCHIQHPANNRILAAARDYMGRAGWEMYDEKNHSGWIRHIVSRVSTRQNEAVLTLVSCMGNLPGISDFVDHMEKSIPELKGIVLNINQERTNVIMGAASRILWGKDCLTEEVSGMLYRISPHSFFQVNTEGLVNLFTVLGRYANLGGNEIVLDLYSGVGVFSLFLSRMAKKVYGIEESSEAVKDARVNGSINRIKNVEFIQGRAERLESIIGGEMVAIDLVILDPPRSGAELPLLMSIEKMRVPRVIYISCNPSTLARDCAHLGAMGYRIKEVQPVDMFPQTSQIESVAYLER